MKLDVKIDFDAKTKEYLLLIDSKEVFRTKNYKRLLRETNKVIEGFDRIKYKIK